MLLLDPAHVVGPSAARRMPRVAELEGAPDRALGAAADPDLRLTRRTRLGGRVVKRPVASLEVALAAPHGAQQPDRLVGPPAATLEFDAHELELVAVPSHADAQREPAAGELLQRGDLLRQVHGVV